MLDAIVLSLVLNAMPADLSATVAVAPVAIAPVAVVLADPPQRKKPLPGAGDPPKRPKVPGAGQGPKRPKVPGAGPKRPKVPGSAPGTGKGEPPQKRKPGGGV